MNGPCGMAGRRCPNTATTVVRIFGVGDRALCGSCVATLERKAPVPEWRLRALGRDMTGALGR